VPDEEPRPGGLAGVSGPSGVTGAAGAARRPAGALESEVLAILRDAPTALSPGEVRQRLAAGDGAGSAAELSYSTVVTIVSRLHAKGLLTRNRSGRGFTYTPVDEAGLAASRMTRALGTGTDRAAVLTRFVSGLSERDSRLLRDLLAAASPQAASPQAGSPGAGISGPGAAGGRE
jgi:predicted transcriptional regulator